MKKLITLFAIITCINAPAQIYKQFETGQKEQIDSIVKAIVQTTVNKYNFVSVDTSKSKRSFTINYNDGNHELKIYFAPILTGGNYDLNKPDTLLYRLIAVEGFYQDLFPFWKNHFEADADMIKISEAGYAKTQLLPSKDTIEYVVTFKRWSSKDWQFHVNYYIKH